ncbi:ABC transporter permease [Tabrizicola sp.]|uniref:ABC transporter permease n=1 Tax=Tabrizicola sp. TaxID=2005166 RepID=UPI0035B05D6A
MRAERLRLLAGLVLALALVLPLLPLALWSLAHGWRFPDLLPQEWSLRAWGVAASAGVPGSLGLTLAIAAATTALAALVGLPAGRALGLHDFPGKRAVLLLLLVPAVLPGIALVLGLHDLFLRLGLTGSIHGVVLAHLVPVLPYMVLVMASVFAGFDTRIEAQARSLGAGPVRCFLHVTLPAVLPGLMTGALFAFLVSWSQYLLTLAIGGGRVQTLPLVLYAYVAAGRNDVAGAIAVLYALPGMLLLLCLIGRIAGRAPGRVPRP